MSAVPAVPAVWLIGCGNEDAGDDGVGLLAVRRARARLGEDPRVGIIEAGPALNAVPFLERSAAVVVDAVRTVGSGRDPGEIVRVEAGPDGLPVELGASLSSHGFSVGDAVAVARALGARLPNVVLGVEVRDDGPGRVLSPDVAASMARLVQLAVAETLVLASGARPGTDLILALGRSPEF